MHVNWNESKQTDLLKQLPESSNICKLTNSTRERLTESNLDELTLKTVI